ncbi:MAG: hypothetical protein ABW003_29000 [Microvirga sp.]
MLTLWMKLALDSTLLGLEAQKVIGLRMAQFASGQGTPAETQLMVTEKVLAFVEAATTVATGGSPHEVIEGYSRHVQANVKRLGQA